MAERGIDYAGREKKDVKQLIGNWTSKLTIMAPTMTSVDNRIVIQRLMIKMILTTDGEIQSSNN
jgi:hypothetical protein